MMNIQFKHPAFKQSLLYLFGLILVLVVGNLILPDANQPALTIDQKLANLNADSSQTNLSPPAEEATSGQFWRIALAMAAVLALMLITWRAFIHLSGQKASPNELISILSRQSLGPKHSLLLVAVGDRQLLLGVTDQQVNLIADLSGENLDTPPGDNNAPQFSAILKGLGLKQHEPQL